MTKFVQIIDGALNCEYAIYALNDEEFDIIFPNEDQDIEFFEDLDERLKREKRTLNWENIWSKKVDKKLINGIHGTLFYELTHKKPFYPNKTEKDLRQMFGMNDPRRAT